MITITWIEEGRQRIALIDNDRFASWLYNYLVQQMREGRVTHVELTQPAVAFAA